MSILYILTSLHDRMDIDRLHHPVYVQHVHLVSLSAVLNIQVHTVQGQQ